MRASVAVLIAILLLCPNMVSAQTLETRSRAAPPAAPQKPNSHPVYQKLRTLSTGGEIVLAENLVLRRDAGTFTFKRGHFAFLAPVEGKVTGAVFVGEGSFTLEPPLAVERNSLRLLSKEDKFQETFNEVVFRFTDNTYDELKKGGSPPPGPVATPASGLLADLNLTLRKKLRYNLHIRILEDVLSTEPGGYFAAFIHGNKYSSKEVFVVDPHGVKGIEMNVSPEEVAFLTYEEGPSAKAGVWAAFHYSSEYAAGAASGSQPNETIHIAHHSLDTTIDKSGKLTGIALTTLVALAGSIRVVPLSLFHTLRVRSVRSADGLELPFIQEDKDEDAQFAVILPKALARGETLTLKTEYGGPEAVTSHSGGNYYPVARSSWYPNTHLGDYATYDMTFRIPKGLTMIASGIPQKQYDDGPQAVSEWKSDGPQTVAGFNFGEFKMQETTLDGGTLLQAYANLGSPDFVAGAGGMLETTPLMKKAMAEAQLAVPLYTDFFGGCSFRRLAMTQQVAGNYGQAWPMLVYLPITYFFDNTMRHRFHMDDVDTRGYFRAVGPHEIAHEWWGHTVTWRSYRDQWMSEGFAEFSASLFIQQVFKNEDFRNFWDGERQLMTEKNREGKRAIDVGPVTLGYRLANTKAGFDIPRRLIYPKGGYVLHMIRMMMWTMQDGDARFKATMHDFVNQFRGRAATTEDFKAVVEQHMTPDMDLTGNHRMDWFFNEWVYGTMLPSLKLDHSFSRASDGTVMLNLKLVQSGVDDSFMMPVPLYLDLGNNRIFRLGSVPMKGNSTFERSIALRGIQEPPKRAMINYFHDVLTAN